MPGKPPANILTQAQSTLTAWNQINDGIHMGTVTPDSMSTEIMQATQVLSQLNALEVQITDLRNQRDALYLSLWDKVKRVRGGVKANYGDDSSQYEMVGGTRLSDRKPNVRKAKTAA